MMRIVRRMRHTQTILTRICPRICPRICLRICRRIRPRTQNVHIHAKNSPLVMIGAAMALTISTIACTPRLKPLPGIAPVTPGLPAFEMPPGHRQITFTWEINDYVTTMLIRGDGWARIASPDSVRVDLALSGPLGGGASVVLIGTSTRVPPGASMTELIPPTPLMWAVFGRLMVPSLADTVVRVQGDTLRADIGKPVQWRITAVNGNLRRVERIAKNRIVEFVDRTPGSPFRYESAGRRSLIITPVREDAVAGFNQKIWTY